MPRCPACGLRTATGCLCLVDSSDCFTLSGDGSEATPFIFDPDLDPSASNLFSCDASGDGLLASLPSIVSDPPFCQVYRESSQSIPNNTLTAVTFPSEVYDTDTMHSTSSNTNRITFTTAGLYIVTAYLLWDSNAVGNRLAEVRKNGTDILAEESKPTGGTDLFVGHNICIEDEFSAADYIECLVLQTSGAALRLRADFGAPLFSAAYA